MQWFHARFLRRNGSAAKSWRKHRVRIVLALLGVVVLVALVNWIVQVARKPAELFFPVSGSLHKAPGETWKVYQTLFREHATPVITAELLAALAQVEGAGNPVARTAWRWRATTQPFDIYRPASSAVGMYQITDAAFLEAKRYCIHDHAVVDDGPWHDARSCWFNGFYTRVLPSHAIEMTSAFLDRRVALAVGARSASLKEKQDLAAVIHLCGFTAGEAYSRNGFRPTRQRCGEHDLAEYLGRVNAMKRVFARLAAG